MGFVLVQCTSCNHQQRLDNAYSSGQCDMCGSLLRAPTSPTRKPPPVESTAKWYVFRDGYRAGPFTDKYLRQSARAGHLRPTDLLWRQGMKESVPASSDSTLFPPATLSTSVPEHFPPSPKARRPQTADGSRRSKYSKEMDLTPYLPVGSRVRSQKSFGRWALLTLALPFVFVFPPLLLLFLLWTLFFFSWRWHRSQETQYGVQWAEYLAEGMQIRSQWCEPDLHSKPVPLARPQSGEHLKKLMALIPREPPALYLGFANVQPRTWTISPRAVRNVDATEAAEYLTFLVYRNLFSLELPKSSVGWTEIDGIRAGIYRVDLNENAKIEVCFSIQVTGNVLSLFWNSHILWLYESEVKNFFVNSKMVHGSGIYYLGLGAPEFKSMAYGHTGVWVRVNAFRRLPWEHCDLPWFKTFVWLDLNSTTRAQAESLVSKINAEIEHAQTEYTTNPAPDFLFRSPIPQGKRTPEKDW